MIRNHCTIIFFPLLFENSNRLMVHFTLSDFLNFMKYGNLLLAHLKNAQYLLGKWSQGFLFRRPSYSTYHEINFETTFSILVLHKIYKRWVSNTNVFELNFHFTVWYHANEINLFLKKVNVW